MLHTLLNFFRRKTCLKKFKSHIDITSLHEKIESCKDVTVTVNGNTFFIKDVLNHGNGSLKYECLVEKNKRLCMYSSPNICENEYHDTTACLDILRGSCRITVIETAETVSLREGDTVFIPNHTRYKLENNEPIVFVKST